MEGQMTIFDFIKVETPNSLDDLPEIDMVNMIARAVGLNFQPHDVSGWRDKRKGTEYTVKYSHYSIGDHAKFISCGYGNNKGGAGSPCDTVDEAISFFKRALAKGKSEE